MKLLIKTLKKLDWTSVRYLGYLGLLGLFLDKNFKWFFLFFFADFLVPLFRKKEEGKEAAPDLSAYYKTYALSNLNPFTIGQAMLQLTGQLWILLKHRMSLPAAGTYVNKVEYILPFMGEWTAVNGGSTKENSHSWDIYTQRYAYDFVKMGTGDKSFTGDGRHLSDYYCYEQAVCSPADGTVVRVCNGVRDYPGVGNYSIDWKTRDFRGNFVVIKHAEGEFSFTAHLQKNSIRVKKGDRVKQGQVIGLCGNSGHSTEPHIHFHLQDSKSFWLGAGLPLKFRKVSARPSVAAVPETRENTYIEKNETVENINE